MTEFGQRLRAARRTRGWPIDRLASASGVSRAMISKIERGESSPTAVVLGKLSAALQLSIAELLAPAPEPGAAGTEADGTDAAGTGAAGTDAAEPGATDRAAAPPGGPAPARAAGLVRRAACIPRWRDPETGYLRRQLSTPRFPVAVTEVVLPAGARVPYPAGAYAFIAQLVWVLSGRLTLADGPDVHELSAGDTFELGEPRPREFRNDTAGDCRYLVVVSRKPTP